MKKTFLPLLSFDLSHATHDNSIYIFFNSQTISKPVSHPSELPKWNYDGSSTGQAPGDDSEVIL